MIIASEFRSNSSARGGSAAHGVDTAAEMLIVAGITQPHSYRGNLGELYGVRPIPASSGNTIRYRLNRHGHGKPDPRVRAIMLS
ncbi:hypothetical protein ACL03I_38600, partial [Nocardia sp. SC052]